MARNKPGWINNSLEVIGQTATTTPTIPCKSFKLFNRCVGNPIHPATSERTDVFDYQEEYEQAWNTHHKLLLNKSRKIGATETALRIILYNCMNGTYKSHHRVMIVAGNNQDVANRFLARFIAIIGDGFTDLDGKVWKKDDIFPEYQSSKARLFNGIHIQAYPANESVRGEENVICVFLSESAFINLNDDTKVYNAVHPNVANIGHADFVMESTPNGKRGFFWSLYETENEYYKLEQPYTVAMGKLLDEKTIANEKKNPTIDFEQEFCCKFTTSLTGAFKEEDVNFVEQKIDDYSDL